MDVIIIGGGKVGRTLLANLNNEGHNVSLIDIKREVVEYIQDEYDVLCIEGSGTDINVLEEAGVRHCDLIIAVTQMDEYNVLCGIMAKKKGAKCCVARVRNPEYYKQLDFMRDDLEINMIVNPEFMAANDIARRLRLPEAMTADVFANGRAELVQIKVNESSPLIGKPLSKIYSAYKVKVLICAVLRDGQITIPNGDFVLKGGDRIHISSTHTDVLKFIRLVGVDVHAIKSVMIIGGGRISYYLARALAENGMRVKIIEHNPERCQILSEALPKASIVCADGTDKSTLIEEGIYHVDALVSLTGIDEENVIISLFAKQCGVDKVITKINRLSFGDMIEALGLDSIVTPQDITADIILSYARAMENADRTDSDEIKTLYRIIGNSAEAIEFVAGENSRLINRALKDIRLKKNIIIAAMLKGNKIIIPDGNTIVENGDSVIIVTTNRLKQLNDILD